MSGSRLHTGCVLLPDTLSMCVMSTLVVFSVASSGTESNYSSYLEGVLRTYE